MIAAAKERTHKRLQLAAYDLHPYRILISEDPIGLAGGVNPYTYAGNDPINGSDLFGLQSEKRCHLHMETAGDNPETEAVETQQIVWHCIKSSGFSSRFGQRGTPGLEASAPAYGTAGWEQWASGAAQPAAFDPAVIVTSGGIAGAALGIRNGASRATGWFAAARAQGLARGGAIQLGQTVFKFGIHEAHHTFSVIGRAVHFQVNWWTPGVRGSGGVFRLPLPWR